MQQVVDPNVIPQNQVRPQQFYIPMQTVQIPIQQNPIVESVPQQQFGPNQSKQKTDPEDLIVSDNQKTKPLNKAAI